MTNATGTLTSQQRYLPFGGERTDLGPQSSVTDLSYTGQREMGMGLMDFKFRFYSDTLGRFISPDNVTPDMTQGLNRYSYVANRPVNFNDPTGHKWDDCSNVKGGYRCQIHMKHAGPAIEEGNRRAAAKKIAKDLATLTGNVSGAGGTGFRHYHDYDGEDNLPVVVTQRVGPPPLFTTRGYSVPEFVGGAILVVGGLGLMTLGVSLIVIALGEVFGGVVIPPAEFLIVPHAGAMVATGGALFAVGGVAVVVGYLAMKDAVTP